MRYLDNIAVASFAIASLPVVADVPVEKLIEQLNEQSGEQPTRFIICARCHTPITHFEHRIEVQHSHHHRFTNPNGLVFNIGCFAQALGCMIVGDPTQTFSWFPGYNWQYAFCEGCGEHLGWYYQTSGSNFFYGLIAEKLIATSQK